MAEDKTPFGGVPLPCHRAAAVLFPVCGTNPRCSGQKLYIDGTGAHIR